jgi:hypothetical protein
MRTLRFITTGLIASLQIVPFSTDRLFQVELTEFPTSRAILLSKLGPTQFDCGRVIFKPAFAPEYSVSVYSRSLGRGQTKYLVAYIAVDQNLWQVTDAGGKPRRAQGLKTRRIDCEIPQRTAEKVKQAWIGMLSGNQQPKPMREEDVARTTDATVVEFSIQLSPARILYGETVEVDLLLRRKTRVLVDLAKTLVNYCKAKQTDRAAIALKIDRKATRLLGMLK